MNIHFLQPIKKIVLFLCFILILFGVFITVLLLTRVQTMPLKKPDADSPVAGICETIVQEVAIITVYEDNIPMPRCVRLTANQKLKIINNSQNEIPIAINAYRNSILPHTSYEFPENVGKFLKPGVHFIGYGEVWLQK